jgi:hypothetical protein
MSDEFDRYSFCIATDGSPNFSPERFASADDAKLAAFDRIADALEW